MFDAQIPTASAYAPSIKGRHGKGMEKGQIIAQKNIARQMLDHGATPDFVCKTSGLSAEAAVELVREQGKT